MKKFIIFGIIAMIAGGTFDAFGAANVLVPKKADSVAKRDASTSTTNFGASLLPTAVNLATNVIALNNQQKALTAECEPTSREITFVNNMIKEWAIAGATNPSAASSGVTVGARGMVACKDIGSNYSYSDSVSQAGTGVGVDGICYDTFSNDEARGAVWAGFPKAAVSDYCSDGSMLSVCPKNKRKKMTNMWTLFDMIDFDNKDYTRSESSQAVALLQKASNCSGNKLAAKRLETFGGFITNTITNLGQPTNTGNVMGAVQSVVGQTGIGGIGNLATVASQFLDK